MIPPSDDEHHQTKLVEETAQRTAEAARRSAERDSGIRGLLWSLPVLAALAIGGCWYVLSSFSWTKGRPLRGRGRRRPPKQAARGACSTPAQTAAVHWRDMAGEEYESIAAFSELALDLLAAGAPLDLVARCHGAALDEARHAEACVNVARSLDGQDTLLGIAGLGATRRRPRWRGALLVRLAVESYVDGWVGEASSARVLGQVARETRDTGVVEVLRVLAAEEMGHARLGEDVVRWCRSIGGPLVERALVLARASVMPMPSAGDEDRQPNLRPYGVPDAALRGAALEAALASAQTAPA